MKQIYKTWLLVAGMVFGLNAVAQTTGSINEYGETIDEHGGILAPPPGDTVKFKRIAGSSVYALNSSKTVDKQQGSALMVVCNDSVYYWKSPLCMMAVSSYWMKGFYDKQANTVSFPQLQPNYYHPNDVVSYLGWCMKYKANSYKTVLDYADAFVFDINGDTLTLRGSQSFTQSSSDTAYFMGGVYESKFTLHGDGGTVLVRQHPVTKRDTVVVKAIRLYRRANGNNGDGYSLFTSRNEDFNLIQLAINASNKVTGSFVTAGIDYSRSTFVPYEGEKIRFYDGELNIFEDEAGYKMQGIMIGTDEKAYKIDLIQPAGTLEMDSFVDLDLTNTMDSVDIYKDDSVGGFVVAANLRHYAMELNLFAESSATTLPIGDYVISDTREPGTALKSIGYVEPVVNPCCVVSVHYYSDGTPYADDLWLFVSGTISVKGDGSILAVGKNSYDRDIRIEFTPCLTDINNYTLPYEGKVGKGSFKVFENGQFRIIRNDKRYTIMGVEE
ncbi:MAG: hypothetical protein MJZ58_00500 [Paludibacteraceae bacterium]|nr:hypothetical protein [Paludibacteraceae bacterium]